MNIGPIFGLISNGIYVALGAVAIHGLYMAILCFRIVSQKKYSEAAAGEFLDTAREYVDKRDYDGLVELCDSPPYWKKALPQMVQIAVVNRDRAPGKLRALLAERFDRDILAELEYKMSWINTAVKTGPMLGLLGTVTGMVQAFDKIADKSKTGGDPGALAGEISFALLTTAIGLIIAIPLVMIGAAIHIRMDRLQSSVQSGLTEFLEDLDAAADRA